MLRDSKHTYRGFTILGRTFRSTGGYVLGGRHFVEGGEKRTYKIVKDGYYVINPSCIISTLKDAKIEVDEYIKRNKMD